MLLYSEIIRRERFLCENGAHPRDSLLIVLQGGFACTVGGKSFAAGANDIFVFPKNVRFSRAVTVPLTCIYLQFDALPGFPAGLLQTCDAVRTAGTVAYLEKAVRAGEWEQTGHFVRDILLLAEYRRREGRPQDEIVSACAEYLRRHFMRAVSLDELCAEFGMSKQGLIRKFKRQTGQTPMDYLITLRIHRAKELLAETALPVGEIAAQCGFENLYYFSGAFRKRCGLSPTAYRRQTLL